MTSQILLDLILTTATSFSLVGLLALAALVLPWREEELEEVERALSGALQRSGVSRRRRRALQRGS